MTSELSMVIPCYMEAQRLPVTLVKWQAFIEKVDFKIETIIVVEPSQDDTRNVAKEWAKKINGLRVIENLSRLGKGGSVRRGLLEAKGNVCAFMDADGSTDFRFFYDGYQAIQSGRTQAVIASRGMSDSILPEKQNMVRRLLGLGFRWTTKYVMGLPFEDTQCGAKMFRADVVYPLFNHLNDYGFAFDVEILLKSKSHHVAVLELPCKWKDVKGSTVHPLLDGWRMLRSLFAMKLFYMFHSEEKPSGTLYNAMEIEHF